MFKNIEKNYKKNLFEYKFRKFYWITALILALIFKSFKQSNGIIYTLLIISVILYFLFNYHITMKNLKIKKNTNIVEKINIYTNEIDNIKINNLISILKNYNFKTKNDLKLAIDYYNYEKPIKIESDYLGWIISISLTLSSFLEIAYNAEKNTIDFTKITIILSSTFGVIIVFLIPIIIIYFLINSIIIPKNKIKSDLSEDLSYIYLNFDKYKNQLNKKS